VDESAEGVATVETAAADENHPPTRNLHIGFALTSHEQVDARWTAPTAAGYRDGGAPGQRPQYGSTY
jgi:hypothetical protein